MTFSSAHFQVIALSSLCVLLLYFSLSATVFACDAPQDADPMVIGVAGDKFIAIYKNSDKMCVFEQPANGVSDSKAHLGKNGKELKEAWPELELPPSVVGAVIVTDSKGGHFIFFQVTPPTTPPPRHKKKRAVATAKTSLGDGPPSGNIVFDVDNKKVVSKDATPHIEPMSISTKEPMTMYQAHIGNQSSLLTKLSFEGDSLPSSNVKPLVDYKLCPAKENDNHLVATVYDKDKEDCKKALPNFPKNVLATGFADDKNFHLMANGKVVSFEKDAISEKLGKPVPLTILDSKDFLVKEDASGGGGGDGGGGKSGKGGSGSTWLVVIIIIVVLLLTAAAAAFVCCRRKNKTGSQGKGKGKGESGKGGKGKGKGKGKGGDGGKSMNMSSKKSKLKGSSSKSMKGSSKKFGSKKSSKKGGSMSSRKSKSKRTSVSKAAITSRNVSKGATSRKTLSSRKMSAKASSKKSTKR